MPGFGAGDIGADGRSGAAGIGGHRLHHRGMAALLGGDGMRIALAGVLVAVGELRRGDGGQHEARAEALRQPGQQTGAQVRCEALVMHPRRRQLVAPQLGVAALRLRQLQEQVLAHRVFLRGGQGRVERGAVQFVAQIVAVAFDVFGHGWVFSEGPVAVRRSLPRRRFYGGSRAHGLVGRETIPGIARSGRAGDYRRACQGTGVAHYRTRGAAVGDDLVTVVHLAPPGWLDIAPTPQAWPNAICTAL